MVTTQQPRKEENMGIPVGELKGITKHLAAKLKQHGFSDSERFLAAAKTPDGRKDLASKVGVDAKAILELANRADLARVEGVGRVFSDLLESAGVDTIKELAKRDANNLHAKLAEVNGKLKLSGRLPTPAQVKDWIDQAKKLPKTLEY
jgi:predicted flap endonuclease-1-like 5' DNA nuclease